MRNMAMNNARGNREAMFARQRQEAIREKELIAEMVQEMEDRTPKCTGCGKNPEELSEYVNNEDGVSASQFVIENERFIEDSNLFYCTTCYIKAGQPLY